MADAYVLDAYAILALLGNEEGAEAVADLLARTDVELSASAINVGEVYYILRRRRGESAALEAEAALYEHPRLKVAPADRERIRWAGALKAQGGLSLADSFAAALALEIGAALVSGDSEFAPLEAKGLRMYWLARP